MIFSFLLLLLPFWVECTWDTGATIASQKRTRPNDSCETLIPSFCVYTLQFQWQSFPMNHSALTIYTERRLHNQIRHWRASNTRRLRRIFHFANLCTDGTTIFFGVFLFGDSMYVVRQALILIWSSDIQDNLSSSHIFLFVYLLFPVDKVRCVVNLRCVIRSSNTILRRKGHRHLLYCKTPYSSRNQCSLGGRCFSVVISIW